MHWQDIVYYNRTVIGQSGFHEIKMLNTAITCSSQYLEIDFISDIWNQEFVGHLRMEFDLELVTP